eukprot:TRINITY_DN7037_c0_g1_i2.p1 TRINITY_DN7037_c0_g1~~TRINITY_DN7037_c0_g1_i2.p1  ORF type:complete len:1445 (-),score=346.07 TRINITY_DN7037_c0_g1_i2:206-4540(-)
MATRGKTPGPESDSSSSSENEKGAARKRRRVLKPRHVVAIRGLDDAAPLLPQRGSEGEAEAQSDLRGGGGGAMRTALRDALRDLRHAIAADDQRCAARRARHAAAAASASAAASAAAPARPTAAQNLRGGDGSSEIQQQADQEDDADEKLEGRMLFNDGLPWWGDAPRDDVPFDVGKSRRAQVTKRSLPAYEMSDIVNEAIDQFQVIVIVGATGCGKSTQLPIARHAWCKARRPSAPYRVVCCEPRRIAAASLAERVALESGRPLGSLVGYKVRFETKASRDTDVLYCTTGVLLRAMMRNPTLEGVDCVFLDEVHERDVLADFTLLVLRDLMQGPRKDLKLVLMSATVDPSWCCRYFEDCHAVDLPGDSPYDIKWHWLENCLEITGHKPKVPTEVAGDHPPEAITAAMEKLAARHQDKFKAIYDVLCAPNDWIDYELVVKLVEHIDVREASSQEVLPEDGSGTASAKGAVLIFLPGMGEIRQLAQKLKGSRFARSWNVLLLHSTLPQHEQQQVFQRPPSGQRKIIVATNIAESSVTIDDVVYVIDSGRERLMGLNPETNVSSLMTQWIARANANQRKGRAGRCRAGSYFALFSEVQYEKLFVDMHPPEMQRTQVETLCLQAKAFGFEDMAAALGRAPDPPDKRTLESAKSVLVAIGAVGKDGELTRLGKLLIAMPVHPQLGKFLLYARLLECTDAALTVAAAVDVGGRLFTTSSGFSRESAERKRLELSGGFLSDHWTIVQAYRRWVALAKDAPAQRKLEEELHLSRRTMENIHKIRDELLRSLQDVGRHPRWQKVLEAPSRREAFESPEDEVAAVSAALAGSLHLARLTPLADLVCLTTPPCCAALAPTSVVARKHIVEPRLFQECLAVWFNRLKTSELFVDDCTIMPALHVLLLGPPTSSCEAFPRHVRVQPPVASLEAAATGASNPPSSSSRTGPDAMEDIHAASARVERERQAEEEKTALEHRRVQEVKELVRQLYQTHNPAKLEEVDDLFIKYEGLEFDMYARICKKYGIAPNTAYLPLSTEEEEKAQAAEKGRATRLLRHVDRHAPWLRCASPGTLELLLDLRTAAQELLNRFAGRATGLLPAEAAQAIRSLRRVLLDFGSLGDLRLRTHPDFGSLEACEQVPAPLEEPWISERRRRPGEHEEDEEHREQEPQNDGEAWRGHGGADDWLDRWLRDTEGELRSWLRQELLPLAGHGLELGHVNELLRGHLGREVTLPGGRLARRAVVTRGFLERHGDLFRVSGNLVTLVGAGQGGSWMAPSAGAYGAFRAGGAWRGAAEPHPPSWVGTGYGYGSGSSYGSGRAVPSCRSWNQSMSESYESAWPSTEGNAPSSSSRSSAPTSAASAPSSRGVFRPNFPAADGRGTGEGAAAGAWHAQEDWYADAAPAEPQQSWREDGWRSQAAWSSDAEGSGRSTRPPLAPSAKQWAAQARPPQSQWPRG